LDGYKCEKCEAFFAPTEFVADAKRRHGKRCESKMTFNIYKDINTFYHATYNVLMRHEAQNVVPLGNVIIGYEGKDKTGWRDPANFFIATVTDDNNEIVLTAIKTGDKNLTFYATDNKNDPAALTCLINGMEAQKITIPGVMAEKSLNEIFIPMYTKHFGLSVKKTENQRIYELTEVNPEIPQPVIRPVDMKDMHFLPYWIEGFFCDCFGDPITASAGIKDYHYHINANRLWVLEDGGIPVTMAKIARDLQNLCVIGMVYTPPYFRKNGYATACVAALSQIALDKGFKKCVLYTDLANPISNSIYQKIGYKPICDSLLVEF